MNNSQKTEVKKVETKSLIEESIHICQKEYEHTIELLSKLIACRSFSGAEQEAADTLLGFFKENAIPAFRDPRGSIIAFSLPNNFKSEKLPEAEDHVSAVGWIKNILKEANSKDCKVLAYNAHMDVVEPGNLEAWHSDPFLLTRHSGKIYGRGSCDMKGAVATMAMSLLLTKKLNDNFQQENILIGCFCTEEEVGEGLAFKELLEYFNVKPTAVILGEPSQMQIARGQRGKLEFHIETVGKRAHTSVPEVGDNAAYKLAKALLAIEAVDKKEAEREGLDPQNTLKRSTLVATEIKSWPTGKSFVPDNAGAHVVVRLALNEDLNSIKTKLEKEDNWPESELVQSVYRGKSYKGVSSDWPSMHPAWETRKDHGFFKLLSQAYQDIFSEEPVDKIWPFSTDGVYSAGMAKIPTLGIGPGRENVAHIIDEWVYEKELERALEIYTYLPFLKLNF